VVTPTTMPAAIITGAAIVGIGRTVHSSISITVVSRGISAIVGGGITAAVVCRCITPVVARPVAAVVTISRTISVSVGR
jgi:hypothetical protein